MPGSIDDTIQPASPIMSGSSMPRRTFGRLALTALAGSLLVPGACTDIPVSNADARVLRAMSAEETLGLGEESPLEDYKWFSGVSDVATDARGSIHVMDGRGGTVKVYDSLGEFQFQYGRKGEGPGEFNSPTHIESSPDGNFMIVQNHRTSFHRFDIDGEYKDMVRIEDAMTFVDDYCVLDNNTLLLHGPRRESSSVTGWDQYQLFHVMDMEGNINYSFGHVPSSQLLDGLTEEFGFPAVLEAAEGKVACDVANQRVFFALTYDPHAIFSYELGVDTPQVVSVDNSLSGGFDIVEHVPRVFSDPLYFTRGNTDLSLIADQAMFGELCLADETLFMTVIDRVSEEVTLRGYPLSGDDAFVFVREGYDQRWPRHRLAAVDDGGLAYTFHRDPFPAVSVEQIRR